MVEISLKVLNFSLNLNRLKVLKALSDRTFWTHLTCVCGFFKIDLDAFVNYGGH